MSTNVDTSMMGIDPNTDTTVAAVAATPFKLIPEDRTIGTRTLTGPTDDETTAAPDAHSGLSADYSVQATSPDGGVTAGLVARKSKFDNEGIAGQVALCEDKAHDEGATIPRGAAFRFIDDGVSGIRTDRDGLTRLFELLTRGDHPPFSVLYVKDRSRLARTDDPRWIFWFEVECQRHGVMVRYVNEPPPEMGPDGIPLPPRQEFILHAVKNFFTSEERKETIRKTRGGRRRRVMRGFWPGGSAPYGTVRYLAHLATGALIEPVPIGGTTRREGHGYKLVWETDGSVEIVKRIFASLDMGMSLRRCAWTLNNEGVASPGTRGAPAHRIAGARAWTSEAVREIARQPLYRGELWYGRTTLTNAPALTVTEAREDDAGVLCHPAFMPDPPIPDDVWHRVNVRLNRKQVGGRGRISDRYVLSGVPTCGHCKATLVGQSFSPRRTKGRDAIVYRYYWHKGPDRERNISCRCAYAGRTVRADILEGHAFGALREILSNSGLAARIAEQCSVVLTRDVAEDLHDEETAARKYLETASAARLLALKRYCAIEDDKLAAEAKKISDEYQKAYGAAEKHLRAITERSCSFVEAREKFARVGLSSVRDVSTLLDSATRDEQRQLFRTVIDSLVVNFETARATLSILALPETLSAARP
jgi:DNA invertase Pin-like site-specific DNA recombinase